MEPDNPSHNNSGISRRQWLRATAGASAVGLVAGCNSDGQSSTDEPTEDSTETTSSTDEQQFVSTPMRYSWDRDGTLDEQELNYWNKNTESELLWFTRPRMGQRSMLNNEWQHLDIEDWEFTDGELRITIKDDVYWHQNGEIIDEVTAEDFLVTERFEKMMTPPDDRSENPAIEDKRADGKTYIWELTDDGYNPAYLTSDFGRKTIRAYRNGWQAEKLEAFEEANETEAESLRQEVVQKSVTLADDPVIGGPYSLEELTPQKAVWKRIPDHWSSDVVNWDTFHMLKYSNEGNQEWQGMTSDRVDLGGSKPSSVSWSQFPNHLRTISSAAPGTGGETVSINYGGDEPWLGPEEEGVAGKRVAKVRQGLLHAMNSLEVARSRRPSEDTPEELTYTRTHLGGRPLIEEYLGESFYEKLPNLQKAQPEKAKAAFEEAGLEMDGGRWVKPNGEPLKIKYQSFSWSRQMGSVIVQNFKDAGVDAEHVTAEDGVLFSQFGEGTYNMGQGWRDDVTPLSKVATSKLAPGTHWMDQNRPEKFKVPPIGEWDAEPTETVEPGKLLADVASKPEEELAGTLKKALWTWTYHLPQFPAWRSAGSSALVNDKHFDWPKAPKDKPKVVTDETPIYGIEQPYRHLRRGWKGLNAKE